MSPAGPSWSYPSALPCDWPVWEREGLSGTHRADVAEVGMGLTAILLPQLPECWDDRMQHHTIAAAGLLLLFSESESDVIQASLRLLSAGGTSLHHPWLPQSW